MIHRKSLRLLGLVLAACLTIPAQEIIGDVRKAIAANDFEAGEKLIQTYQSSRGVTPEMIVAVSWLGRGALAAKRLDKAEGYAAAARDLALAQLKTRKLDAEPHLPIALGASIEVQSHVLAANGQLSEAVSFLNRELATYRDTSMRTRIQKNLHLLSLEGKPAPALDVKQWVGRKPPTLNELRGKPAVLFFWAHWCSTCKSQLPALTQLMTEYRPKGLMLLAPTQHYGYTEGGKDATPAEETAHIDAVRKGFYAPLGDMLAPISEETMKVYGVSTTPTLVFVDTKGIVQKYHPGLMSHAELVASVKKLVAD